MSPKIGTNKLSPRGITVAAARRVVLDLPDVAQGRSYGMPSFLLHGHFFARFRDDDTVFVLQLATIAERDVLMDLDPHAFFFTEHYRNYPAVLIRLVEVPPSLFAAVVREAWEQLSAHRAKRSTAGGGRAGSQRATSGTAKQPPPNMRLKLSGRGGRQKRKDQS
jgi:hypothetical protein